ncbi:MAG: ArnT family glycosyltransferase [Pirellulales bacterium]
MNTASRLRTFWGSLAVVTACAVLLVATSPPLAIVWDEGDTIARAAVVGQWLGMNDRVDDWPYTVVREGHPPLAGILVALGQEIAPAWLDPLTQTRLGPIVLFSLAAGAMFYRLTVDYRTPAVGGMAVLALVTMPRVFAHAHYATLDGPLTACWILAWAAFVPATRDARWIVPFGFALGLTLAAKFTGWLAIVPLVLWAGAYRDRGALRALAVGVPIALAVFVLLNPPLWSEPVAGLRTFFELNLQRAARHEHNITTQFFGRLYDLDHPLPWYNTLVWTAVTVTPIMLLLGLVGIVASVRRWRTDHGSMLLVANWATLVVVRAMPFAPPHDAERLILPSFAFFAALIGVGVGRGLYRNTLLETQRIPAQGWAKVALAIAAIAATVDTVGYYPHNLSYYSRLVGGVRGATALGMEPTYYWDALDRPALAWLREHTAADEKVAFAAAPPLNLQLLKRWGLLARLPNEPGTFRWYVVQRRPSAWQPPDRWLIEHAEPAYQRAISGVPLLDVYPYADYKRAMTVMYGEN